MGRELYYCIACRCLDKEVGLQQMGLLLERLVSHSQNTRVQTCSTEEGHGLIDIHLAMSVRKLVG
jgi:hypothetical protein